MRLKNVILMIIFYIFLNLTTFSYINISPTTLDRNIGTGAYEEFTFYNNTNIPLRYKLSAISMEDSNIKDMSKWIEIYPKVVTIYPTEEKSFKVYIQAPEGSETGDYGAFINIRQVSAPKLESGEKETIAAGMAVMVNVNMGIYGYIGDLHPKVTISNMSVTKKNDISTLKMNIENKSNRLVRMLIEVKSKNNYIHRIGEVRAMKGEKLYFEEIIPDMAKDEIAREVIISDVESEKNIITVKVD